MSVEISLLNKLYGNLGYWLVFTFSTYILYEAL